ncbi:sigma intracellular receptor 2 isoform X2 [Xiphias gladius]|uniref:sigma intracellular receptor 2 isoform X2 n=1 Tax=Xiphias gladius TaxID=8245 RepID=UPI001A9844CB|nr:sigma intracellular receptor 2 isoform X2 [Xiphias gladius]XP_039986608.1 sigma intracellular receptor 2 isoform X2 [Xiphias gladius]XP_039986609.1 sigma intracellular receptor 2 isoform X2 [Xiphias gladius]
MADSGELHVTVCLEGDPPGPFCIGPDKYQCQFCSKVGEYPALVAHKQTHEKSAVKHEGGCKWIRTPAIMYSTHVATTLVPILAHILFYQFPMKPHRGPQTLQERWLLVFIYAPYLLVPVLLLLTMLLSSTYSSTSKSGHTSVKTKKTN